MQKMEVAYILSALVPITTNCPRLLEERKKETVTFVHNYELTAAVPSIIIALLNRTDVRLTVTEGG